MINYNPLNFKVGHTAYLDGTLECTIQSISDKGMFCVVTSPLYSTPYEVVTNRLLRGNVLKDTPVHVKLKQHLDSITQEQFDKEWNEVVQSMEGVESPTMEEFINNQKDLDPEYSEIIRDNFWELTDNSTTEGYGGTLEKLVRDSSIDFAKWLAKEWMSIWVEDKWLWENVEVDANDKSKWIGYYTEEQLYELYLKDQG